MNPAQQILAIYGNYDSVVYGRALSPDTRSYPQNTLAEIRSTGVRGILIYCSDYHCSHSIAISADQWPDDVRLSDLEPRFVCQACGKRGADIRPDFYWNKPPVAAMGYR